MRQHNELAAIADKITKYVLSAFGLFLIVFWLVNLWSLVSFVPDAFQRLGSLWVAMIVMIYGFSKLIFGGLTSIVDTPDDIDMLVGKGNRFSITRFSRPKPDFLHALKNDAEYRQEYRELMLLLENRLQIQGFSGELFVLALATLQWGYGDLFHCWAHGNGWQICY